MDCLDPNTVTAWFDGELPADERKAVEDHLDACDDCRALFCEFARDLEPSEPPSTDAPRTPVTVGERIERYTVLEWLGEGGMGVVYGAYDPKLDRRVALKLLRAEADRANDGERLLREAQSLARVSHPNVVAVYDAGTHAGYIFVAMEHVRGGTLAEWLRREKPPWRTVLARFLDAARGLAAVHAAGLVHRDFKPSNVLFGADGRVRVTDFGLARVTAPDDVPASSRGQGESSWLGTPAYVSPEQLECRAVDARSDQYSFCVALHEALYGQLPGGEAPDRGVPARFRRAIARGLSKRAHDRFASMDALIAALSYDPRARWLRAASALLLLACVGLGGLAYVHARARQAHMPAPCAGAERKLAGIWDDAQRRATHASFLATGVRYAADAWSESARRLDAYAGRWTRSHTQACEATRVHGEQSEELMELRIACLDQQAREMKALTDVFAAANARIVERSAAAVSALAEIEACADVAALRARVRPPSDPAVAAEVARLRVLADQAMALERAGDGAGADRVVRPLLARVTATGDRSLESDVHFVLGKVHVGRHEWPLAERFFYDALAAAEAAGDANAKARALVGLLWPLVDQEKKLESGEHVGKVAAAVLSRLPAEAGLRATLESRLAFIDLARGRYAEALTRFERNLAFREANDPDSWLLAGALNNVALALKEMGEAEKALQYQKRSAEMYERCVGSYHPAMAAALSNAGLSEQTLRRLDDALRDQQRARAIFVEAFTPENPWSARTAGILADVLRQLKRPAEALPYAEETVQVGERLFPEDGDMASALHTLAMVYLDLGRTREAIAMALRAQTLCVRLGNLRPQTADVFVGLGKAYLAADLSEKAIPPLEQALAMRMQDAPNLRNEVAEVKMTLARALWDAGRNRPRARTLAEQARDTYATLPGYEPEHTALLAWLRTH